MYVWMYGRAKQETYNSQIISGLIIVYADKTLTLVSLCSLTQQSEAE